MTFGRALGELVRLKRRTCGLTQVQLAEDAFGTAAKVRRISELEGGLVSNPHPRTIDPIISVLGITGAEIEECARAGASTLKDDLADAYREAVALIDDLARQFELDRPDAGLVELDRFLRAKAAEWAALRARIHQIDAEEADFARIRCDAEHALSEGDLDRVDTLLLQAEDVYQRARTLAEIRKMASLRISRGDAFLLKGDGERALDLYRSGVELFRPLDEAEMIGEINYVAHRVYESSHRSLQPLFFVSAALLEILLTLPTVAADKKATAEVQYRLGLSYRNEYDDPRSNQRGSTLAKAIHYSRHALALSAGFEDPYKIMVSTIGLANCLRDRARFEGSGNDLVEAFNLLRNIRNSLGHTEACVSLLPHLLNSLGAILRRAQSVDLKIPGVDLGAEALAAYRDAVVASEGQSDLEVWGVARFNIGALLAEQADAKDLDANQRAFLRVRAMAEFNAAIETYPATAFPFRFAEAQRALGQVLFHHALTIVDNDLSEAYLFRALNAFEGAAEIIGRDRKPLDWAAIQMYVGAVFECHARFADVTVALGDMERAVARYEAAASVFTVVHAPDEKEACDRAIDNIRTQRRILLQEAAEDK